MRVLELTTKNIILLCVGLTVIAVLTIVEPFLVIGLVVGFGAGLIVVPRWNMFKFAFSKSKDERIKEYQDKIDTLKEVKK